MHTGDEVTIKLMEYRNDPRELEDEAETYRELAGEIGIPRRIHRRFLHRDIKPDNFLLGIGRQGHILYTIDFGLAKEFSNDEKPKHRQGLPFGGTCRYASINNHKGLEQSWADDLESLGYMFVQTLSRSLFWFLSPASLVLSTRHKKR
ncbi:kinase-like domain-containing protein [Rostrohypoxylon terebratum]|nr:kinase-like domain-containing protein [Rostrohypoxylon terebratum]